jgi:hypothetical protein
MILLFCGFGLTMGFADVVEGEDPVAEDPPTPTLEEVIAQLDAQKKQTAAADAARVKAAKEAEAAKKKLKEREDAEAARQEQDLPESERAKRAAAESLEQARAARREADEIRAELLETRISNAIEREAAGKFVYPDVVSKLIDRTNIAIDPETKEVTGVKAAVAKLLKDRPGLALAGTGGGTPAPAGSRRPGTPAPAAPPVREIDAEAEIRKLFS